MDDILARARRVTKEDLEFEEMLKHEEQKEEEQEEEEEEQDGEGDGEVKRL